MMREDNQLLMLTHLSQLFSAIIIPLIIWLTQKDKVFKMDEHGKSILNFQISYFIYSLLCLPLILLFGLGFFVLIILAIIMFVFPILNAIKAANGERTFYPFVIQILK